MERKDMLPYESQNHVDNVEPSSDQNSSRSIPDAAFENAANSDKLSQATGSELVETVGKASPCQGEEIVPKGDGPVNKQLHLKVVPRSFQIRSRVEGGTRIIVTGAFPPFHREPGVLIETIRDPDNPARMAFLRWENGRATILNSIESNGQLYVPPDPTSASFPALSLADGILPCETPYNLLTEIASVISQFVTIRPGQMGYIAAFVLASWFADCFEAAPYLWVVGPLGSGKTKLLKVMRCLCRRGLIAGDLRSGSVYKLVDAWDPTLIIDELELGSSVPNVELLRMLRTGSTPGVPTIRNGQRFSTYSFKIISSRQPIGDAALMSRGVTISMLPANEDTDPLDEAAMQKLEQEFQPKLLGFRLQNHTAVKNFSLSQDALDGLSPRIRQIARALAAPFLGDVGITSELVQSLGGYDEEGRIDRSLEPEWLVAEALMIVCHPGIENGSFDSEILVGELAAQINQRLADQSEDHRLGPKKVGMVLRGLGLPTTRLGRSGRGLKLTLGLRRKIHEVAAQLGIDRRTIAASMALRTDYGGVRCALCEEFGLTDGLRFTETKDIFEYPP